MDPAKKICLLIGLLLNLPITYQSDIVLINESTDNGGTTTSRTDIATNTYDKANDGSANTTGTLEPADDDQDYTNDCALQHGEPTEENNSTRNDQPSVNVERTCKSDDDPLHHSELFLRDFKDQFCGTDSCTEQTGEQCFCDLRCYFYKDCCYLYMEKDYIGYLEIKNGNVTLRDMTVARRNTFLNDNNPLTNVYNLLQCVTPANESRGFWLVSQCPKSFKDVDGIKGRCEQLDYYYYDNMPVDYVLNGTYQYSFINVFCALCNGVDFDNLVFWKIEVLCSYNEQQPITPETTTEEILTRCPLRYRSDYMFYDDLRSCNDLLNVLPVPTLLLNPTVEEEFIIDFCESTIMPISANNSTYIAVEDVYRNPYCLLLFTRNKNYSGHSQNDSTIFDDMICAFGVKENFTNNFHNIDKAGEKFAGTVDLTVFFVFDKQRGVSVQMKCDQQTTCQTYEIWECVTKSCRTLYCGDNLVPVNSRCVNAPANQFSQFEKPIDSSQNSTHILEVNSKYRLNTSAILSSCNSAVSGTFKDSECVIVEMSQYKENYTWIFYVTGVSTNNITAVVNMLEEQVECIDKIIETEIPCGKNDNLSMPMGNNNRVDFKVLFRNYAEAEHLQCTRNELIVDNSSAFSTNDKYIMFSVYELVVPVERTSWFISIDGKRSIALNTSATCASIVAMSGLNCSLVSYNTSEVSMDEDNVTVLISGREFSSDHYFLYDDMVFVCAESVTSEYTDVFEYMNDYIVLTCATSGISIVSLLFVILYHVWEKRLLNIHGLHITALSVVTLLIHVLLVIQTLQQVGTFCVAYAIILHFLLLNMFSWMNVIGVDMARFFASGNLIAKRSPWRAFRKHLAISLMATTVFILVALIFEFLTDDSIKPNYGKYDVCWLTNGPSIICFVIVPVGVSLLINLVSYILTVRCMMIQAKQARLVSSTNNKTYFFVYLKLSVIFGLSWIVGLLGAFVSVKWLGVLHIILNGLQGLSLLICAVVNKRVIASIKSKARYLASDTGETVSNNSAGHINGRAVNSGQHSNRQDRPPQKNDHAVNFRHAGQIYTIPNTEDASYESMDFCSANMGHHLYASNESSNTDDVYLEPDNKYENNSKYRTDM